MANLINKFIPQRHCIFADESEVIAVLGAIDVYGTRYSNLKLEVGRCAEDIEPKYWAITFNATYGEGKEIVRRLHERRMRLYVDDEPENVYLTKGFRA